MDKQELLKILEALEERHQEAMEKFQDHRETLSAAEELGKVLAYGVVQELLLDETFYKTLRDRYCGEEA